ncbi:MAG: isoprenylcysteine carboxylmethyltransferase family protein [Acidobacteria bacterium]|nr:isoprenylcysteine carboxylmethyltransferase family protein [Acidobacteriota bacterium]
MSLTRSTAAFAVAMIVMGGLLFGSAGRWDLPMFWVYLSVAFVFLYGGFLFVWYRNRGVFQERFKPGPGEQDRWTRKLAGPLVLASLIVAGLDVGRYHWSDSVPLAIQIAALIFVAAGIAGWMYPMSVNPYFSSAVRIRGDREHRVITQGPYKFVRHPGYLSAMILFPAMGISLGSWWASAPMMVLVAIFLRRIGIEDRMLHKELPGYAEYASRVQFRLIPHIW